MHRSSCVTHFALATALLLSCSDSTVSGTQDQGDSIGSDILDVVSDLSTDNTEDEAIEDVTVDLAGDSGPDQAEQDLTDEPNLTDGAEIEDVPVADTLDDEIEEEATTSPEEVTIVVLSPDGSPMAAAPILIQDSEGTVVADDLFTDDEGIVVTDVPAGGIVSTVAEAWMRRRIYTVMGVQPGDEITLQDPFVFFWFIFPDATLPIEVPGPFPEVGDPLASRYYFQMSCGSRSLFSQPEPGQLEQISFYSNCYEEEGDIYNVLGWALGVDDAPLAFTVTTDQEYPPLFRAGQGLDLGLWRQHHELSTLSLTLTNAPADVEVEGFFNMIRADQVFRVPGIVPPSADNEIAAGQGVTLQWRVVPGFAGSFHYQLDLDVATPNPDEVSTLTYARRDPSRNTSYPIDMTSDLGAPIEGLAWEIGEDVSQPTLSWETIGETGDGDQITFYLGWLDGEGDDIQGYDWWVSAPPDTESPITLPKLSAAAFSEWRFVEGAAREMVSMTVWESDFVNGYDDFRATYGISPTNLFSSDLEAFVINRSSDITYYDE